MAEKLDTLGSRVDLGATFQRVRHYYQKRAVLLFLVKIAVESLLRIALHGRSTGMSCTSDAPVTDDVFLKF